MKERFATIDLMSVLFELRERVLGMRLSKVYDIDSKTYLLKMGRSEEKAVILFQSGARIHLTDFSWPKNMMPSGFSMKCRKHLHNKRLVEVRQLGVDRIADLQFGSDQAAQHLIIELYDRGNVVLTDNAYCILGLLRPRTDSDSDVRFAVGEQYPVELARQERTPPTKERLVEILAAAQPGQPVHKVLSPHCEYSSALIGHCLLGAGFDAGVKLGKGFKLDEDVDRLVGVLEACRAVFQDIQTKQSKGYIIQKTQSQPTLTGTKEVTRNEEFHPMLFQQHRDKPHREFPSVNQAVDEFFSTLETQKIEQRTSHMEKEAVKKVKNVDRDHERRLLALQKTQEEDKHIAQLIELNVDLVERACLVIRSAVASALAWEDIAALVKDAQMRRDPVAMVIHKLKLNEGLITLLLSDPYDSGEEGTSPQPTKVDIDLELTAFANARRYYHHKLHAAEKEQRTIQASAQAHKSAKKKAAEAMKEVAAIATVQRARKTYWFEKYLWSISSDNYLIIGGRDRQQNEHVVKKHLRDGDLYVHADVHGATSVIVKNPAGTPVPPRTLQEAGTMAVCYSSAWEAHIAASAWWVESSQVSKTAPSGEYLQTGSFMVRGRKNYLTPFPLVLGFAFLFKLDERSTPRHKGERQAKLGEEEASREQEEEEEEVPGREDNAESGNSENEDVPYPDTVISFQFSAKRSDVDSLTEAPSQPPVPAPGYPGNRHMSAKQRRDSKKQGKTTDQNRPSLTDLPVASAAAPQQDTKQQIKRDKTKQKRSKKYLDQDEEERKIRMDLLGASGGTRREVERKKGKHKSSNPKKKYREPSKAVVPARRRQGDLALLVVEEEEEEEEEEGEVSVSDEDLAEHGRDLQEDEVSMASSDVSPGDIPASEGAHTKDKEGEESVDGEGEESVDREGEESVDRKEEESVDQEGEELAASTGGHSAGNTPHVLGAAQLELTAQESTEKDVVVEEEEEEEEEEEGEDKDQLSVLDSLTGCPLEEDGLLFAIPVCAPYQALTNYKYKVKLIPGTARRGQAAKTALYHFVHSKEATSQEKNLLKSVKDTDLSRYFPGRVKLSIANKATAPKGGGGAKAKRRPK